MAVAPLKLEIGLSDRRSEQELVASYDAIKLSTDVESQMLFKETLSSPSLVQVRNNKRVEPPSAFRSTVVPGPRPST